MRIAVSSNIMPFVQYLLRLLFHVVNILTDVKERSFNPSIRQNLKVSIGINARTIIKRNRNELFSVIGLNILPVNDTILHFLNYIAICGDTRLFTSSNFFFTNFAPLCNIAYGSPCYTCCCKLRLGFLNLNVVVFHAIVTVSEVYMLATSHMPIGKFFFVKVIVIYRNTIGITLRILQNTTVNCNIITWLNRKTCLLIQIV